ASPRLVVPGESGMTRYLTPPRLCRADASMRVRYVVLPRRSPGAATELAPIHRSEAIAELAEHALNLPRHGYRGVETVLQLAADALRWHHLASALRHESSVGPVLWQALRALTAAGLEPIVLKGAALAYTAYPEPALRTHSDIDLLLGPDELPLASDVLAEAGFW